MSKQKTMRTVTTFIFLIVVVSQLSLPTTANATGLPVIDIAHITATVSGWLEEAGRFALDQSLKIVLQALKKRVLDTMTDQIVNWINGGGKPKFTQDFGSVFTNAADAAVGDVLQQYAATNAICQPFAFDINLQLQQPAPLSQQISCSLTSVISNYKAYQNNFSNGGWLAYQELLKPQNNQWGAEIITQNEIINRTAQKTNAAALQQQVNVGFNSQECTGGWDLIDKRTNLPAKNYPVTHLPPDGPRSPDNPPPPPGNDPNLAYRCTSATVSTPGRALATGLEKSLYSGLDLIINAQDLSNSLAIIADAAFNRLIKAGVDGLKSIGQSSTGNQPNSLQGAATDYQNTQNQVTANVRNTYLNQLSSAVGALASASSTLATASSTNQQVIVTGNDLLICLGVGSVSPDVAFAQGAVDDASDTIQTIANKSAQWNIATSTLSNLIGRISSLACDLTCLNQIGQQNISDAVNTANALNVDLSNTLISIQGTLSDLKTREANDCHT